MKKQVLFLLSLVIAQNFSMDLSSLSETISDKLTWENAKTAGLLAIGGIVIYDRLKARRTPKVTAPVINTSNFVTKQILAQYATKQELQALVTKDQLTNLQSSSNSQPGSVDTSTFATKEELTSALAQCATKQDLQGLVKQDQLANLITLGDLTTKLQALQINTSNFATKQDLQIQGTSITELFIKLVEKNKELHENVQELVNLTGPEGSFMQILTQMTEGWKEHDEKIENLQTVLAGLKLVITSSAFKEFFETTQSSALLDIPIPSEDDEQDLTNKVEKLEGHITALLTFFNSVPAIQRNSQFEKLYDKIMSEDQTPLDLLDLGLYPGTPDLEIKSYSHLEYSSSDDDQESSQSSPQNSPTVIKRTATESSTGT